MRLAAVLPALLLPLAGCASGDESADGVGGPGASALPCALEYPDGSPVDCTQSTYSDVPVLTAPPSPQTGWLCKDHNAGDTGNDHQVWMNVLDGRLGVAWDYSANPLPQPAIVFATLYQQDQDQLLLVPFQDVGFLEFPLAPTSAPMEIHIIANGFRLHANEIDPFVPEHWHPADGQGSLLVSPYGKDPWVAWTYSHNGTVRSFDVMVPVLTEAGLPMYRPRGGLVESESPWLYSIVTGGGAKYPARDPMQMRANPGFCYAEDRP